MLHSLTFCLSRRCITGCLLLWVVMLMAPLQADAVESVIARARAAMGPEKVLDNVQTLYYRGRIHGPDGEEEGFITMTFKKPYLQRVEWVDGDEEELTVVDRYEGYRLWTNMATGDRQIMHMSADRFRLMADLGLENIYFFRGPNQRRGAETVLLGQEEINGVKVDVVEFRYPGFITITRYFEHATGRLIKTHSTDGDYTLIEEGDFEAGGITFPRYIHTEVDGERVRSVEFFDIVVNRKLDESTFAYPSLRP